MALLEDRTAVFIIRIWCERGDPDSALSEWRGSVEHVQSGQRAFFRHLENAIEFMQPHLQGIGIDAQQRFWERISSVMSVGGVADADASAVDVDFVPDAFAQEPPPLRPLTSTSARKRR
jgi:hypothetical protein